MDLLAFFAVSPDTESACSNASQAGGCKDEMGSALLDFLDFLGVDFLERMENLGRRDVRTDFRINFCPSSREGRCATVPGGMIAINLVAISNRVEHGRFFTNLEWNLMVVFNLFTKVRLATVNYVFFKRYHLTETLKRRD